MHLGGQSLRGALAVARCRLGNGSRHVKPHAGSSRVSAGEVLHNMRSSKCSVLVRHKVTRATTGPTAVVDSSWQYEVLLLVCSTPVRWKCYDGSACGPFDSKPTSSLEKRNRRPVHWFSLAKPSGDSSCNSFSTKVCFLDRRENREGGTRGMRVILLRSPRRRIE